jgi:hypothetical protein
MAYAATQLVESILTVTSEWRGSYRRCWTMDFTHVYCVNAAPNDQLALCVLLEVCQDEGVVSDTLIAADL